MARAEDEARRRGSSAEARRRALTLERACVFAAVWLVLTAADPSALPWGAGAIAAATWLSLRLRPDRAPRLRLLRAARRVPSFLGRSFLAGVDVARRAFDPRLPLAPGWFEVPTTLPEGSPRVLLGGEFSLVPGTLVAGTRGGRFLVHVLDRTRDPFPAFAAGEAALRPAVEEVEA